MTETIPKKNGNPFRGISRRQLLIAGMIALLCAVLFLWGGVSFLPQTTEFFRRTIVNDDYNAKTVSLGGDSEIRQTMNVRGRLYGVRLLVDITDADAAGEIELSLLSGDGAVAATGRTDTKDISNGFFHLFLFDTVVDAEDGAAYTLILRVVSGGGGVAFYKSGQKAADYIGGEGEILYPLSDFALTENGEGQAGTLALQYVTKYSGDFIYKPYIAFSILLTGFVVAAYLLLAAFRVKLHVFFLAASLLLGAVFMFLIPLRTAPDEYVHIATAYHYTNRILGVEDVPGSLTVRPGDGMFLATYDFEATDIFAYQEVYEGLFEGVPEGEHEKVEARIASSVFPLIYLPQTLGVLLARLFGVGRVGLLLLGRFFNLLFYSVVVMFAVKKMPFFKTAMVAVGLLPMSLQLAASFSYDTYVIALSFLFAAVIFDLAYRREAVGWREMLFSGALMALIAPAKAVYLPLLGLFFLIPNGKYRSVKKALVFHIAVILAAVVLWSFFNLGMMGGVVGASSLPETESPAVSRSAGDDGGVLEENASPVYEVGENNEAKQHFSFGYILRHVPQTLLVLSRSIWEQSPLWLQGMLGGRLGEIIAVDIEINWLIVIGFLLILILSVVQNEQDRFRLKARQRAGVLLIALTVAALFLLACFTWTPINYETLFGVQGRYFLPVLPLALFALRGKNLQFKNPVGNLLILSECGLVVLTILNAFFIIIKE